MKTKEGVWIIIAASLVLIGCIIFVCVMKAIGWDFKKLSSSKYENSTYEISDPFDVISMKTNTADIIFAFSNDGKCKVECHEKKSSKHSVSVKDGALTVELIDDKSLHSFIGNIGIGFDSPCITVYLPKEEYTSLLINGDTCDIRVPEDFSFGSVDISLSTGDVDLRSSVSGAVKIKTSTGDIRLENLSVGSLDVSVSTGDVTVSDVICENDLAIRVSTGDAYLTRLTCKNVISTGTTGDISLNNVIVTERLSVERSTGDIALDGSDAAEIFIKTDTGDVTGTLLTDKDFITYSDTGDVDVPKYTTGGRCEITTDTGDIKITIRN